MVIDYPEKIKVKKMIEDEIVEKLLWEIIVQSG